jgi:hypothetical protein
MKLWEITRQIEDLAEVVGDGEITGDMVAAYHGLSEKLEEKVDHIIEVLGGYKMRQTYLDEQAKKFRDAAKANAAAEAGLKEYVRYQIEAHPELTFRGEKGGLVLQKSAPALELTFKEGEKRFGHVVEEITDEIKPYCEKKEVWVLDTKRLAEDIKAGNVLPWASLKERNHIRTKV